jgi:Outer membrane protein beta-barrel domain
MRLFILLLFIVPAIANAQGNKKLWAGVKAGLNLANTRFKTEIENENLGMRTAFHGGIFARYKFSQSLGINGELVFSSEGYKKTSSNSTSSLILKYINIPVLFRYSHSSGVFAQTGPQFGLLMNAKSIYKSNGNENEDDVKKKYKSTNLSWGTGIGYTYKKIGIEARYNLGLGNIFNIGGEYKYTPSTIQLSLQLLLL